MLVILDYTVIADRIDIC